jgi:hypothetical protein
VLLPKRRGTIASAAQTPSSRHSVARAGMAGVPARGRARVEIRKPGLGEWRAGPGVEWGCAACAPRSLGQRDDAIHGTGPCPRQPPRGADHPHPTPPARDEVWSQPPAAPALAAAESPRYAAIPHPRVPAGERAASAALEQLAAPAALLPRRAVPASPSTIEPVDRSHGAKPSTRGVRPRRLEKDSAPLRTACTFPQLFPI